ncbi:MAG: DUF308 domain-containing protein [Prevotella sp.]|nr:DUF308 domain-containing protein [Prevotella sp.]
MKILQSSIFRAVCALIVGALIIKFPDDTMRWLTIAIGILFLVSGVIALIAYWNARQHASEYTITDSEGRIISNGQPTFPIVGAGSVILGLVLALTPAAFAHALMYILGAVLILGGINLLMALVSARRFGSVPLGFWIAPSLILLTGLFVVIKPMETAELPLIILGWCALLYGVTEIINALKIHAIRKQARRVQQQAEAQQAEEMASETVEEGDVELIEAPRQDDFQPMI